MKAEDNEEEHNDLVESLITLITDFFLSERQLSRLAAALGKNMQSSIYQQTKQ